MLLRWLLIGLYALGMLVVRTRGLGSEPRSPREGRRQRDRTRTDSPRLPASSQPPSRRPLGSDPRQMMLAGIIVTIIQLLAVVRFTPGLGRMLTLTGFVNISTMMAVPGVGLVLLPALAPALYQRHAGALLAVLRVCYFALPNLRDPLDVQYVFQNQPSTRPLGFVSDAFSLLLGLRGVALLLAPLVCPVPMLPHLAMSAFAVERLRTNASMCSSPMLQHSVWRRRISWTLRAMGHLPLLAPEPEVLSRALASGPEPLEAVECSIFLTLCQVAVGIVAPMLLLAKLHAPVDAAAAAATVAAGDADEVEAALWSLCQLLTNRAGSPLVTLLAWWLLLSVMWVGVLLLEQPRLLLSPMF